MTHLTQWLTLLSNVHPLEWLANSTAVKNNWINVDTFKAHIFIRAGSSEMWGSVMYNNVSQAPGASLFRAEEWLSL